VTLSGKTQRSQRTDRRVSELKGRLYEVRVGTIGKLPTEHEREVVERAEVGATVGLGDDGLAGGLNLTLNGDGGDAKAP